MLVNYFVFIALIVNCGNCTFLTDYEAQDYDSNDESESVREERAEGTTLPPTTIVPELEPLPSHVTPMRSCRFLVSLKHHESADAKDKHFCPGAILNKNTVLTNAHCLYKTSTSQMLNDEITVYTDTTFLDPDSGILFTVKSKVHPEQFEYTDPYTYDYDIALVRLNEAFTFSEDIKPAVIGSLDTDEMTVGEAFGWERTSDGQYDDLATVTTMLTIGTQSCVNMYGPNFVKKVRLFCTMSPSLRKCKGGPIGRKDNKKLIGFLAFVKGCDGSYPSVYVKLQTHQTWINTYLNSNSW